MSYNNIGDALFARNHFIGVFINYSKALEIYKKLAAERPDDLEAQRSLSASFNNVGRITEIDSHEGALNNFRNSLDICERLAAIQPDDPAFQRDLAYTYYLIAGVLAEKDDTDGALFYHKKALEIREMLADARPEDPFARDDLAESYLNTGLASDNIDLIAQACEIWSALAEKYSAVCSFTWKRDAAKATLDKRI